MASLFALHVILKFLSLRLRLRNFTAQDVNLTNDLLSRCYIGDWFLLHLLAKNTSTYMFRDVYLLRRNFATNGEGSEYTHDVTRK